MEKYFENKDEDKINIDVIIEQHKFTETIDYYITELLELFEKYNFAFEIEYDEKTKKIINDKNFNDVYVIVNFLNDVDLQKIIDNDINMLRYVNHMNFRKIKKIILENMDGLVLIVSIFRIYLVRKIKRNKRMKIKIDNLLNIKYLNHGYTCYDIVT